jgi:hypothetical protein
VLRRTRTRDAAFRLVARRKRITFSFLSNPDSITSPLNTPTCERIERWRAEWFAGAQAEARVMPGASNAILDEQTFREWTAVVRTRCTDREDLVASSREKHGFSAGVAE